MYHPEMPTGMNNEVQASLVVPVRNRSDLLLKCLSSLITQDIPSGSYEIVVCDDGSTEDIASVVERFQPGPPLIRLLQQSPLGPAAARNLGVRNTNAPIVIFVDSDVIADRALVRYLVTALRDNRDWKGAEASIQPTEGEGGVLWDAPVCSDGGRFHTAAIAYRRDALMTAGGLDETFKMPACEDVELAVRVLPQGTIGFVPEAVVFHPTRRVTLHTHWRWRHYWRYEMILAKRYGILAFPGQDTGWFPRLRVALAAVATLPAGRFLNGLKYMTKNLPDGALACFYALFDVFCGLCALPDILLGPVPVRRNYLQGDGRSLPQSVDPPGKD